VLVMLAAVALAGTQAILRPLREATELAEHAGEAAGEGLACATPRVRADGNQNHWPFGMALARISGQLRASSTAEAAARRSAADMAGRLGEVALEVRRSVNVVHGFAEYCRQRGKPPSADVDRMLQRVADEVTRMETLLDRLDARSVGGATRPDLRPDPHATGSGYLAGPRSERHLCTPSLHTTPQQRPAPNGGSASVLLGSPELSVTLSIM
jgi:signal transduction histidine kinase